MVASVDDLQKVWLQSGTSNKESVNVWLGDKLSGVLGTNGTTILYSDALSNFLGDVLGHPLSDVSMGSFGNFWGSSLSGSNSPDWLVGKDDLVPVSD